MAPARQSSVFSRKIVNLLSGMAAGSPDLPRVLADRGYRCHAIEASFAVGPKKLINPELMLCSETDEHTLIVEAKSGANLKPNQLERYALVSAQSLETQAYTTPAAAKNHDVLVIGQESSESRLLLGSKEVPSKRRVLCVAIEPDLTEEADFATNQDQSSLFDGSQNAEKITGLKRIENSFASSNLNKALNPTLEIDWELVPTNFLPVDHESEDWEFGQYIFPEVIAAILNEVVALRIDEVAKTFIRHWDFISSQYQKTLLERIRHVVRVAAQKRFSAFITYDARGRTKRDITLTIPQKSNQNIGLVRHQLQRKFRELMEDLNSPQIAIIYED